MTERASFSRKEFAARHGIGLSTVDRLIAQGKLPIIKIGRHTRIPLEAEAPIFRGVGRPKKETVA